MKTENPKSRKRKRRRRILLAALFIALPLGHWCCFPSPVKDLWPPEPREPAYQVDIVFWDWHTFVIYPQNFPNDFESYLEWEFVEEAWYLEGKRGVTGAFRSVCWPTDAALGRLARRKPFWDRHPNRDLERWTFYLSENGMKKTITYLESDKAELLDGYEDWYAAESSYHIFFLCHHFTLQALREGGLPVAPWWGFTGWMTRIQLNRVQDYHEEAGLVADGED